jgi:hypothetical protein
MYRSFRASWLALLSCGCLAAPAGAAESSDVAQLDHLIKAAAHLELAGLTDKAAELRTLAGQTPADVRERLLQQKLAASRQLAAELAQLRQLATGGGPQVCIALKVLEFHPAQLRKKGFPLVSLQRLAEADGPTSLVDDQGTLSEFFELLEKQALVTVLCRPQLMTVSGQTATVAIGSKADSGERTDGFEFQCTPRVGPGDKIALDVAFSGSFAKANGGGQPAARAPREALRTQVEVKSGQRAILGGLRTGSAEDVARILLIAAQVSGARPEGSGAGAATTLPHRAGSPSHGSEVADR